MERAIFKRRRGLQVIAEENAEMETLTLKDLSLQIAALQFQGGFTFNVFIPTIHKSPLFLDDSEDDDSNQASTSFSGSKSKSTNCSTKGNSLSAPGSPLHCDRNDPEAINPITGSPRRFSRYDCTSPSRQKPKRKFCKFCLQIGKPTYICNSHQIRNNGIVECKFLRKLICPLCGATGDKAHTQTQCPLYLYEGYERFQNYF
ncbi:hypothetical protein ILUMI_08760 [Ignelater luminosus]|uniref:Nanos-type domain-containing protein n=1 Tax=Ignelater luminosus TaxID=2038154 RepID=A0A8K0DAN7_IGNLU|nr:hypothetical protein ILUMI_08760 [Ignelater luminosus]